ncbi:MFS transporter [Iodidimonas sp. SYSU 1G8]|uniref:MFS transporter n=1 Tax=Iodidimonas sp. SYSU 1G8 TaxID=3133967 RepID=UPI0031FE4B26
MSSITTAVSDGRMDIGGPRLIALTCLLLLVFSAAVAMSFNISGFVTSFNISFTEAGTIATLELGGIAVSSLVFSQLAPRLQPRTVYTFGIGTIALMNAATIFVPNMTALLVVRAIAGMAAGSVTAMVMYTAGHSRTPEKTFGIINSFVGVLGIILALVLPQAGKLYLLPGAPAGTTEADGLFLVYLVASIAALFFVRSVPVPPRAALAGEGGRSKAAPPLIGWLALVGIGIIFFGHGVLALYIVDVGKGVGLSAETIGLVFSFAAIMGIALPLIAGFLGAKFPATPPVFIVLVLAAIFALLLGHAATPLAYFLSAPIYAFVPIAMLPIALGALVRIDPSGRLAAAHPAFVTLGGAAAPLTGGAIRDWAGNFSASGWFVVGCIAVGAVFMAAAMLKADQLRRQQLAGA